MVWSDYDLIDQINDDEEESRSQLKEKKMSSMDQSIKMARLES